MIVLKRDAVAKVVLNNLYKHTQLQENFGANMLAIVDGVPRTLPLDGFITALGRPPDRGDRPPHRSSGCARPRADAHILRGYLKALDALDEVIALIRRSPDRRGGPRRADGRCSTIDELQADAILQPAAAPPRRARAAEDQDQAAELETADRRVQGRSWPSRTRQREIISDELTEIVDKFGDDRRTEIMFGFDGDMNVEDLIPEEEMVVTVTRDGYIKRTRSDNYRSQHRGGKGVEGRAAARG